METINFELSKKLNELGLLDDIDTEYYHNKLWMTVIDKYDRKGKEKEWHIKTLTLEEAIELLPDCIEITKHNNDKDKYLIDYNSDDYNESFYWKTLLEAIENVLEFLLDNNLLWKQ